MCLAVPNPESGPYEESPRSRSHVHAPARRHYSPEPTGCLSTRLSVVSAPTSLPLVSLAGVGAARARVRLPSTLTSLERLIRRAGGPAKVSTVFDVGAWDGADSLPLAQRHPDVRFVAVEPTPDRAEALRQKSAVLPNYTVVEAAVASQEGSRTFNVFAGHEDLNSLHQLNHSAAPAFALQDAEPDSQVLVSAKRLSTICDELGIRTIDVLHIDTQGNDLDVLRSLDDDRLRAVRAGVIEVPYRMRVYEASETADQARTTLQEMGFRVYRIERVHPTWDGEHNYFFAPASPFRLGRLPGGLDFRAHLLASELRARPVHRLRGALAIRTRIRKASGRSSPE
jgi:FkbM family methyltransferase